MTDMQALAGASMKVSTNIPGLDVILDGGFINAGVYMVHGAPGSGKTIFANQLCFGHIAAGGKALYVTLLAESHSRLMQHLRQMDFFDESVVPSKMAYISAFSELEAEGLKGLITLLRREVRKREATMLVLDGLVNAAESASSDREMKKFIYEIQTNAMFHNCTVFLLTSGLQKAVHAEHTMVDGLIELEDRLFDYRSERLFQVRKFRGARPLRGKHAFEITQKGLQLYPRIEVQYQAPSPPRPTTEQFLSTGVPSIDELIACSGLPSGSSTIVVGSTGTGKTTLGLHYLSRCTPQAPGLLFGFFEPPERLRSIAQSISIDIESLEQSQAVSIVWHALGENILDSLGHQLLTEVRTRGIKRLVIDGLSGFFESATFPERIGRFLACLLNELRNLGVTVLMALETRDVVTSAVPLPYGISALIDNLIFFRFAEESGDITRLVSLIKVRGCGFTSGIHKYEIRHSGLSIDGLYTAGGDVIPSARAVKANAAFNEPT